MWFCLETKKKKIENYLCYLFLATPVDFADVQCVRNFCFNKTIVHICFKTEVEIKSIGISVRCINLTLR